LCAALTVAAAVFTPRAFAAEENPKSLSEATSQAFQKLPALQNAKNYDEMLRVVQSIPNVGPTSYDRALILDMIAKIYVTKEQYDKSIAPWEEALKLGEDYKYFDEKQLNDIVYFLAQICASIGSTSKDPAQQRVYYDKAITYFRRWLGSPATKVTPEAIVSYASLLYYKATADQNHVDTKLIQEAKEAVKKGLLTAIHPKEGYYQLLLNIYTQENDYVHASETLELLINQYPQKKDYWPVLMFSYLKLVEDSKGRPAEREYLIRAIATVERAQALGHMKTPKDNMNLVSLYLQANQFTRATEFLYAGMKAGTIENIPSNWVLLGYYYQQAEQPLMAIHALEEATKIFPDNGQLEMQLGDIFLQQEDTKGAFPHYVAAVSPQKIAKLEKPFLAYQRLSYAAFEMEDFGAANQAVEAAQKKYPEEFKKDTQFGRLKMAIDGALFEREEAAKAKKAAREKAGIKE